MELETPVMCHVSRVMCHMTRVTCHVSRVVCHMSKKNLLHFFIKKKLKIKKNYLQKILDIVVELVGGGSVINGAYPSSFLYYFKYKLAYS